MSVEAPVLHVAPATVAQAPSPLGPEVQERLVFRRIMVLLIVPLYFLIVLTLRENVRHRVATVAAALGLDPTPAWPVLRLGYHSLILGLCALPTAYGLIGLARLARRGVRPGYRATICACVVVGLVESAAIALAVYRFHA